MIYYYVATCVCHCQRDCMAGKFGMETKFCSFGILPFKIIISLFYGNTIVRATPVNYYSIPVQDCCADGCRDCLQLHSCSQCLCSHGGKYAFYLTGISQTKSIAWHNQWVGSYGWGSLVGPMALSKCLCSLL